MRQVWPLPIRAIHWASAALLVAAVPAAFAAQALTETRTDVAEALISGHILAGLALLVLTTARLSARLVLRKPRPLDRPAWQRLASGLRSVLLYALLLAMPLTGILKLTLSGLDVSAFGVDLIPASDPALPLARVLSRAHAILGKLLIALALVHALLALAGRRQVLARMWRG